MKNSVTGDVNVHNIVQKAIFLVQSCFEGVLLHSTYTMEVEVNETDLNEYI